MLLAYIRPVRICTTVCTIIVFHIFLQPYIYMQKQIEMYSMLVNYFITHVSMCNMHVVVKYLGQVACVHYTWHSLYYSPIGQWLT